MDTLQWLYCLQVRIPYRVVIQLLIRMTPPPVGHYDCQQKKPLAPCKGVRVSLFYRAEMDCNEFET